MIQSKLNIIILSLCMIAAIALYSCEARSMSTSQQEEPVIPSPNQIYGDEESSSKSDIQRRTDTTVSAASEAIVPIYVSPYLRPERDALQSAVAPKFDSPLELAEPVVRSVAPKMATSGSNSRDLKAAASYGHGHHGSGHGHGYGDDHGHGWLDMGAWTGGKGSFGWYADYPVGSKHGAHY